MDGQITVLAGTTFAEFVDRHRSELIRVLALTGCTVAEAASAVDAALLRAERRWDQIDVDPSAWVIDRSVKELRTVGEATPPTGMEHLPLPERLDAILVNYLGWTPSHRTAAGAQVTAHAERYAEVVTANLALLGPIPPRSTRTTSVGLRIAGIVVAIAAATAALVVAANVGGPAPLASIPTLPPLEELAPLDEPREARLLAGPRLQWSTPLGVSASEFVQIGATTIGYSHSPEGVRAWSTVNGDTWTDHGIVIPGPTTTAQITEGGPGALAMVSDADRSGSARSSLSFGATTTSIRLYSSPDGVAWTQHESPLMDEATSATIIGSSSELAVVKVQQDPSVEWNAMAIERLEVADRAVAEEFGARTQGTDFLISGPTFGIAKRIRLADLGLDPADAPLPGVRESVWHSSDFESWSEIEGPVGVTALGAALPGGEVAVPVTTSGVSRYVIADHDEGASTIGANRLVTSLRPFGDQVAGVSGAFPLIQIVTSPDLIEWRTISPDLAEALEPSPSRAEISTASPALVAAFTTLTRDASVNDRTEVYAGDLLLTSNAGAGLTITRGPDLVANLISLQDERLMIHDLDSRTITILDPSTEKPIVTISFETASKLVSTRVFSVNETIQLLFTPDTIEWSVETPPFYDGGPIQMTDLHFGNGIVILAAEETAFPYSGTHVLVGRLGRPTSGDVGG